MGDEAYSLRFEDCVDKGEHFVHLGREREVWVIILILSAVNEIRREEAAARQAGSE